MSKVLKQPLPSSARRVFKGVIFDVYQWDQELFDGTKAVFERIVRPDTMEIIALVGEKIILQHQEQPRTGKFLSLPGGRIDSGEEPLNGAKRELLEEAGYASDDWYLLKTLQPHTHEIFTIFTYIARKCRKMSEPTLDAGEKISSELIPFDDLLLLSENEEFQHRDFRLFLALCRFDTKRRGELYQMLFPSKKL